MVTTRTATFPPTVAATAPDGRTWNPAKAMVRDGTLYLFAVDGGRVGLVAQADGASEPVSPLPRTWEVQTADGLWTFTKGKCGCSSPLRSFDPKGWNP